MPSYAVMLEVHQIRTLDRMCAAYKMAMLRSNTPEHDHEATIVAEIEEAYKPGKRQAEGDEAQHIAWLITKQEEGNGG